MFDECNVDDCDVAVSEGDLSDVSLSCDITTEEVQEAVKALKTSKALGPDGLTCDV